MNGFVAPDEEVAQSSGGFIAPDEETTQWSDLPKNIIPDATAIGKGALGTAERIGKGVMDIPSDTVESIKDEWGGNFSNTPIMQDLKTVGGGVVDAVKGIPQQLENLGSKEQWVKHPVQNTMTAASLISPIKEGLGVFDAAEPTGDPNLLQRIGAGARNNATGISEDTVKRIAKGQNPVKAGVALANNLEETGATGASKMETWDNVKEQLNDAGKDTRTARDAIKKESERYGGVEDPTIVKADSILEDLMNTAKQLKESSRSGLRQLGRFWNETYESLSKKAANNGGFLTLEDIHSELQDVGDDMKGNMKSPRYNANNDIYRHLIQVQDNMVSEIANNAQNPALRDNLLNANKRYSTLSKVFSDVTKQGERSAVGADTVLSGQRPFRAAMRAAEPALGRLLLSLGNKAAKYGPILKAAAAKGAQNLAMTDYLLQQSDPDYTKANP